MTQGTAGSESVELHEMYNLPVERVPPHRPVLRVDHPMEVRFVMRTMSRILNSLRCTLTPN